jgi:hypothetical protein
MNLMRTLLSRWTDLLPVAGFHFDRPLVLFQSDDWGRVGLRDREGLEQLQSAGLVLGDRPYDFYTLEASDDLDRMVEMLQRHRDSSGRHPCLEMNFIVANLDFGKMSADSFQQIHLLTLAEGLPRGWSRPGLIEAYRSGIAEGLFHPALHGTTHFCRPAVERNEKIEGERANLLRLLWQAATPYIHWRMPWIGYEYWDPGKAPDDRFLSKREQDNLIGPAIGAFAKAFSTPPRSACAPGYRANDDTHSAWAQHGIRVAQNGPGAFTPPHFDRHDILQLSRTVEFEPAVDPEFSVQACLQQAETCFARGIPAIVSVHSINFHSTVRDFCGRTLQALNEFLTALESKHSDLLYLNDEDLLEFVQKGCYQSATGTTRGKVTRKSFTRVRVS